MRLWRGPLGGAVTFVIVTLLVAGGLGWATFHALRLEEAQSQAAADLAQAEQVRLALWRLDSRVNLALSREDGRPYGHYDALYVQVTALNPGYTLWQTGSVYLPSPLLGQELPDWMLLHFQVNDQNTWKSPQVVDDPVQLACLQQPQLRLSLANVTPARATLLKELAGRYKFADLYSRVQSLGGGIREVESVPPQNFNTAREAPAGEKADRDALAKKAEAAGLGGQPQTGQSPPPPAQPTAPAGAAAPAPAPPAQIPAQAQQAANAAFGGGMPFLNNELEYQARLAVQGRARMESRQGSQYGPQGEANELAPGKTVIGRVREVRLGPMVPLWLPNSENPDYLVVARQVRVGDQPAVQAIALDWRKLGELLRAEVTDLFPDARLTPRPEGPPTRPEQAMTALPLQLDPGPPPAPAPVGWSWLRIGLALAWAAALVALLAVGSVGWSLVDLSERRFRFVSAVTHELRTPLTTLRLYLDLLTSGLVSGEEQRADYLRTMHAEADRLHRLVGNVLDYARLERGHPKLTVQPTPLDGLLERLTTLWRERCDGAGKVLVVECGLPGETTLLTDPELVAQVVGNLIDNACKYSKEAADRRVWLRVRPAGGMVAFEVEDRGPGVRPSDREAIFRPFRRGKRAEETAGGVGLGLALAQRWAVLLGGRLTVQAGDGGVGACFRLELPRTAG